MWHSYNSIKTNLRPAPLPEDAVTDSPVSEEWLFVALSRTATDGGEGVYAVEVRSVLKLNGRISLFSSLFTKAR